MGESGQLMSVIRCDSKEEPISKQRHVEGWNTTIKRRISIKTLDNKGALYLELDIPLEKEVAGKGMLTVVKKKTKSLKRYVLLSNLPQRNIVFNVGQLSRCHLKEAKIISRNLFRRKTGQNIMAAVERKNVLKWQ